MSSSPPNTFPGQTNEAIANEFKRVLNTHGYPFQEAVLRRIGTIGEVRGWEAWMPEFPVSVQDRSTRIDIVLASNARDRFIVCECKRANPAIANWCFAQSQLRVSDSSLARQAYAETLRDRGDGVVQMHFEILSSQPDIYHIAVEARTKTKGDKAGSGKGQIEEAAGQVCLGLNGLIDFFYKRDLLKKAAKKELLFLPMIVTTAKLYVTDDDLSFASIESGELGETALSVREVKWLWYRYHQAPALKHEVPVNNPSMAISDILFYEFARTIAIVTPDGIGEFLNHRFWLGK